MSDINKKVSSILDVYIPEGKWQEFIDRIDNAGEPTRKHMTAILFALCEEIESLESIIKDLTFQAIEKTVQKGK